MVDWSADYANSKLPSRIKKGDVRYYLQITSGAFPYIINYAGWDDPYGDRPTIALQAYGRTEEEAVEMMIQKLREVGLDV